MDYILHPLSTASTTEWIAVIFTMLSVALAGQNHIATWGVGIIAYSMYAILFTNVHLYADVFLQLFFISTSIIGWVNWIQPRTPYHSNITTATATELFRHVAVGFTAVIMYYSLTVYTKSNAVLPIPDGIATVISVSAQLLLLNRRIQTWIFWGFATAIYTPIYWSRGLELTAVVFFGFWIHAWYGWWAWSRIRHTPPSM